MNKKFLKKLTMILFLLITIFLVVYMLIFKLTFKADEDYTKINLGLNSNNIDYYTLYENDPLLTYKVYKLNMFGKNESFRKQLEQNVYWSKNKFYEYEMMKFYEKRDKERIPIDRSDLYYYNRKGTLAIFDLKNEKLYYLKSYIYGTHKNYNVILGINTKKYINREIYSVREGLQNDGVDYYVYKFSNENGNDIVKKLNINQIWNKDSLDNNILDNFKYNKEIFEIKNGYYHYELVCRTSDKSKKHNFTKEEATGYEIGVYDADKNVLYYYWSSI